MHEYFGLAVTILAVLIGIGVNLLIAGMFFGRVTTELKNLTANMITLAAKVNGFDAFSEQSQMDRAQLGARMIAVENSTRDMAREMKTIGERQIQYTTIADSRDQRTREVQESQGRDLHNLARNLQNLITGKASPIQTFGDE